jgi:hypothetical protein
MKKFVVFLIFTISIASLILPLMVSCGGNAKTPGESSPQPESAENAAGEPDAKSAEDRLLPDVPENLNLGGYEFRLLYNRKLDETEWGVDGIEAEAETGDLINDAAYIRNVNATEKYNFKIIGSPYSQNDLNSAFISKIVKSGADEYDLVIAREWGAAGAVASGCFVDLKPAALDLGKPWWDEQIIGQSSVCGKYFGVFGDFIVTANNALRILFFNKDLIRDNELEDPYILVSGGKWTLDKMYDMSKGISLDLNGDGVMDKEDRFGIIGAAPITTAFSAGEMVTSKDENDVPVISVGSERALLVYQKVYDILNTPDLVLTGSYFKGDAVWLDLQAAFENNQGLFFVEVLQLAERMRASDVNFGLIPYPKYDENQANYYAFADSHCMNHMFVPATNRHIEETLQIMEILNAESYYTMRPAYYDKALTGKFVRDEESSKMLDIILANKLISQDMMYGWGMYDALNNALGSKSADFVSVIEKNAPKVQKAIDKFVDAINSME